MEKKSEAGEHSHTPTDANPPQILHPMLNPTLDGMRSHLTEFDTRLLKDFFYDSPRKHYLYRTKYGNYITQTTADIRRRLKSLKILSAKDSATGLTAIDGSLSYIQEDQSVEYAGALAGYPCGMYKQHGKRILVTSEAKPFEVKEGACDVVVLFLENMLGHDRKQLVTFYCWLRGAVFHPEKPLPILVIAGPASAGKSLLQWLITQMLGGRCAKPYSYLIGATQFNSDLFGAEHLVIDDESASTDYRSRERLGNHLKQIAVGTEHRLHAKVRDALMLSPRWSMSVSLNDEPENLQVLPRMERSLDDKLILLQAKCSPMPMPTETEEERKAFREQLLSDASALLYTLREDEVPEEFRSHRYSVKAYHHPEILRALSDISKEAELLELIEEHIPLPYRGTATALETRLRNFSTRHCEQLFTFPRACAQLLGRLQKIYPKRINKERTKDKRLWIIGPEDNDENDV